MSRPSDIPIPVSPETATFDRGRMAGLVEAGDRKRAIEYALQFNNSNPTGEVDKLITSATKILAFIRDEG